MTHTDTSAPDMNDLQNKIIQSIKNFSEIQKIKVDNNFIQKKINEIYKQREEFRNFAEESVTQSLKMSTHADDLVIFAECCEDDYVSDDDLLELLRTLLSDAKLNKNKARLLKNKLNRVKISLDGIVREITEYNEKITKNRRELPDKIDTADKVTDEACSFAKGGLIATGAGVIAAAVAAPFTGGASLVAEAFVILGAISAAGGAATTTVSTVVAGASSATSLYLNYELYNSRESFSRFLREMQKGLENINIIISHCESHWEKQVIEIDDIIKKLSRNDENGRRLIKPFARAISSKAKTIGVNSGNYSVNMRQALNVDSLQ